MVTALSALASVAGAKVSSRRMNIAEAEAAARLSASPRLGGTPLAPSPATRRVPKSAAAAESHALGGTSLPNKNSAKKGTSFTLR